MKRLLAVLVFGGLALALSQCSSSSSSSSSGSKVQGTPLVHFTTPQACAPSDASAPACTSSTDCAAGSTCLCEGSKPGLPANQCVPSNCRVDADCGAGKYCSPTMQQQGMINCRDAGIYAGAYCHTPQDDCTNDSDCGDGGNPSFPKNGVSECAYDPEQAKWTCQTFSCLAG